MNIKLHWDLLDPRWDQFNKTKLAQILNALSGKAVIRYLLFQISGNRLAIIQENPKDPIVGEIEFTSAAIHEILKVQRLTSKLRHSHSAFIKVNHYILSLQ